MISRIFMICDAYESGMGHGLQQDGLKHGAAYYKNAELAEAYDIGYKLGDKRASETKLKPPVANPLSIEIADSAARSDIEVMCAAVTYDGLEPDSLQEIATCWYDTDRVLIAEDWPAVKRALEYLDGRGMLERCPDRAEWVRIKTGGSGDGKHD